MSVNCPVCARVCDDGDEFCMRCHTRLGAPAPGVSAPAGDERAVGVLLGIGIFLLPLIFGWAVFRRGHSALARTLTTVWMLVFACSGGAGVWGQQRAREQVVAACRKNPTINCDCFAERLLRSGARIDDSPAALAAVRDSMRGCLDKERAKAQFLTACNKPPASREMCECTFEKAFQSDSGERFFDLMEAYGKGERPDAEQFSSIARQCARDTLAGNAPADEGQPAQEPARPAEPPPPPKAWSAQSADGHARLEQVDHDGTCTVSCAVDGARRWSFERGCDDDSEDLHFVAADCQRWAVFYANPPRGSLLTTHYISVFDGAKLGWHVVGAALVKDQESAQARAHLVAGLGGVSGEQPRYSSDGSKVEFSTIEFAAQAVPLRAEPPAPPPSPTPKKRRK
jgi:hypothetical protein